MGLKVGGYTAPEVGESGKYISKACDVYGCGALFFELVTGRPPKLGSLPSEFVDCSEEVDRVVESCMHPELQNRCSSVSALQEMLKFVLDSQDEDLFVSPELREEKLGRADQKRPLAYIGSVLLLGIAFFSGLYIGEKWISFESQIDKKGGEVNRSVQNTPETGSSVLENSFRPNRPTLAPLPSHETKDVLTPEQKKFWKVLGDYRDLPGDERSKLFKGVEGEPKKFSYLVYYGEKTVEDAAFVKSHLPLFKKRHQWAVNTMNKYECDFKQLRFSDHSLDKISQDINFELKRLIKIANQANEQGRKELAEVIRKKYVVKFIEGCVVLDAIMSRGSLSEKKEALILLRSLLTPSRIDLFFGKDYMLMEVPCMEELILPLLYDNPTFLDENLESLILTFYNTVFISHSSAIGLRYANLLVWLIRDSRLKSHRLIEDFPLKHVFFYNVLVEEKMYGYAIYWAHIGLLQKKGLRPRRSTVVSVINLMKIVDEKESAQKIKRYRKMLTQAYGN